MNKSSLEEKKLSVEQQFNALTQQRQDNVTKNNEIDLELARLQGEHRLIEELINNEDLVKKETKRGK